jgi:hypothetical protein
MASQPNMELTTSETNSKLAPKGCRGNFDCKVCPGPRSVFKYLARKNIIVGPGLGLAPHQRIYAVFWILPKAAATSKMYRASSSFTYGIHLSVSKGS